MNDVRRTFTVRSRRMLDDPGAPEGRRRGRFWRQTQTVTAVDGISLSIDRGEIVGFLGPNGAGKTTTLKMLAGLLHPTDGTVRANGYVPSDRDRDFLRSISLVMGQRQQLIWDIPVIDSFELNRAVYRVPQPRYRQVIEELIALLDLSGFVNRPARTLSLGQRMRCELAAALIHTPSLIFLDEPTLGLDFEMQKRIRAFIREYNARHSATIVLTSHYMTDVEHLCKRIALIHHGKLIFDGLLDDLATRLSPHKQVLVKLRSSDVDMDRYGEVLSRDERGILLSVPAKIAAQTVADVLQSEDVSDLEVTDPPLEDLIQLVFDEGGAQ
ncbi:MAG: ATP-binding cassette domain-containing protein [Actinobacteria bacterium]|nr:ATP-binding cassette domain-containing protein [Actinomycetota bacterium]